MPSDASGRHPSGVLVRPAPDFFDDNLATGGFWLQGFAPVQPHYATIALYNNDTLSRSLKVYGISVQSEGGSGMAFYFVQGPLGAFYVNCQNINSQLQTPPGQIYQQHQNTVAGTLNPYNPAGPWLNIIGSNGFDSNTVFSPFPMFIVSPGYSLVATNLIFSDDVGCFFWYQVANE
ncbi:MAG TPA: hypothetical protein VND65_21995 [Candidatus Binatia bacterium]|nr:hypothetical protein [Candidatus Binatia bacterium]